MIVWASSARDVAGTTLSTWTCWQDERQVAMADEIRRGVWTLYLPQREAQGLPVVLHAGDADSAKRLAECLAEFYEREAAE